MLEDFENIGPKEALLREADHREDMRRLTDSAKIIASHPWVPELEGIREECRQDIARMVEEGRITAEDRLTLLSILDKPRPENRVPVFPVRFPSPLPSKPQAHQQRDRS